MVLSLEKKAVGGWGAAKRRLKDSDLIWLDEREKKKSFANSRPKQRRLNTRPFLNKMRNMTALSSNPIPGPSPPHFHFILAQEWWAGEREWWCLSPSSQTWHPHWPSAARYSPVHPKVILWEKVWTPHFHQNWGASRSISSRMGSLVGLFSIGLESESEVAQSCPTLCDPMDCSLPGSSVHGIFQAGVLEWVAIALGDKDTFSRAPKLFLGCDWSWLMNSCYWWNRTLS